MKARARALRTARAVTIAAAMVMGPGCAVSHTRPGDEPRYDGGPIRVADAHVPGYDAGEIVVDAHVPGYDAGPGTPDAGACPEPEWTCECEPITQQCCTDVYFGWWDESRSCCMTCAVGPMVPPPAPV